ncbi:MAG: KTSC domain-containing protein, partial [Bryobacteraceae bacterium]
ELEFHSGAIYHYFEVPLETYRELLQADSKGRYFNQHIRNCFRFQQIRRPAHRIRISHPKSK